MNPDFIDQLQKQQAAGMKVGPTAGDPVVMGDVKLPPMDTAQNQAARQARMGGIGPVDVTPANVNTPQNTNTPTAQFTSNDPADDIIYTKARANDGPAASGFAQAGPVQNTGPSIRERIEAAESALGRNTPVGSAKSYAQFLDDRGDETFYVKNISNGHVTISDMENVLIKRNEAVDLLQSADLEAIRKSRDLRKAMQMIGGKQWLKRLTPEEFMMEVENAYQNKQQVDILKSANAPKIENADTKIRPVVTVKLEKLRIGYIKESAHLGLTPIEFVEWALSENLNSAELEYIIGSVTDLSIKKPLMQKKAKVGSGVLY